MSFQIGDKVLHKLYMDELGVGEITALNAPHQDSLQAARVHWPAAQQTTTHSVLALKPATEAAYAITMVRPEDCALFVIVGMDGVVNAHASGVSKPDAAAVLRHVADQWDPDRTGSATLRPTAPPTRPNGDPL